jgi:hypothetical protein
VAGEFLPLVGDCLKTVRAGVLDVAYYEAGAADGDSVLLHGSRTTSTATST